MHKDIKSFCIIMGMVGASTASSSCEQKLASVACLQVREKNDIKLGLFTSLPLIFGSDKESGTACAYSKTTYTETY